MLERVVARQFVTYLDANCLILPSTHSGFRRGYSTTAIICVLSDLLDAVDRDDTASTAMLVLFDLSAAFDTVDHGILLDWRDCKSLSVSTTQH